MRIGELRRMKRFGHVVLSVLVLAFIGLLPAPAKAWLYYSVPPIQGTITDATTGKPIENVVLTVRWMKTEYGPFEPHSVEMKKMYAVTDKNGVFRIPSYWSIHIFSSFKSVRWVARHPLHSTVTGAIDRERINVLTKSDKKTVDKETDVRKYASFGTSGAIIVDFKLLSLKDKYKDQPGTGNFRGELFEEFLYEGPSYFTALRKLGLTQDTDTIFKEWDEIAGRFKDIGYVQDALKNGKEKITAGLGED